MSREQTLPLSERLYRVLILAYPKAFWLKYGRRYVFNLVSPVLFFGGLVGALVLNVHTMARLNLGRENGSLVGTVRVELKAANLAVAAVSPLVLVALAGYVFLENFALRF